MVLDFAGIVIHISKNPGPFPGKKAKTRAFKISFTEPRVSKQRKNAAFVGANFLQLEEQDKPYHQPF